MCSELWIILGAPPEGVADGFAIRHGVRRAPARVAHRRIVAVVQQSAHLQLGHLSAQCSIKSALGFLSDHAALTLKQAALNRV